jgi:hypothetical protein
VLEVSREETNGKGLGIPNNKAVVTSTPRDNMVCAWIFYYIISFSEKWRRTWVMESLHWLWNSCRCHAWWVCTWTRSCKLPFDLSAAMIPGLETDLAHWDIKTRFEVVSLFSGRCADWVGIKAQSWEEYSEGYICKLNLRKLLKMGTITLEIKNQKREEERLIRS